MYKHLNHIQQSGIKQCIILFFCFNLCLILVFIIIVIICIFHLHLNHLFWFMQSTKKLKKKRFQDEMIKCFELFSFGNMFMVSLKKNQKSSTIYDTILNFNNTSNSRHRRWKNKRKFHPKTSTTWTNIKKL